MNRSTMHRVGKSNIHLLAIALVFMLALPSVAAAKQRSAATQTSVKGLSTLTSGGTASFAAGSTGDGPATDADCDRYANSMNSLTDLAINLIIGGKDEPGEVEFLVETIDATRSEAEDQGCFVVD